MGRSSAVHYILNLVEFLILMERLRLLLLYVYMDKLKGKARKLLLNPLKLKQSMERAIKGQIREAPIEVSPII